MTVACAGCERRRQKMRAWLAHANAQARALYAKAAAKKTPGDPQDESAAPVTRHETIGDNP
jgi:predicted Fe-S protein YdhL (DUF1289 family)